MATAQFHAGRIVAATAVVALAAVVVSGVRGCGTAEPWPSSMAWDSRGLVVAWAAPEDHATTVYAHRFDRELESTSGRASVAFAPASIRVFRGQVAGPPEIALGSHGALVLVADDKRQLHAIALTPELSVTAKRRIATDVDAICAAPGASGNGFAAAWIEGSAAKRHLKLAALTESGELVDPRTIAVTRGTCALAVRDDRVGLVFREDGGAHLSLHVSRHPARRAAPVAISGTHRASPLRLVGTRDGWALLIGDGPRRARIVRLDQRGGARGEFALDDIDPASVDFGVNAEGFFASWIADGSIHVLALDGEGGTRRRMAHEVVDGALGTRGVGSASWCAATWTDFVGRVVNVIHVPAC